MNGFLQQTFNGNYSMDMWIANLIPCLMVFVAFIINMLFIPSMTQAIFGGAAGMACSMRKCRREISFNGSRGGRSVEMFWYLMDVLALQKSGLARPLRYLFLLFLVGCLIAGIIYACAVFHAVSERSHAPHVHTHSTH